MTYKEMHDSIDARRRMDSNLLGVDYTKYQPAWIYQLITQTEDNIQRRTSVLTDTLEVTVGSAETATLPYDLPATFGKIKQIIDTDGNEYTYRTNENFDIIDTVDESSDSFYTIRWDGTAHTLELYPNPTSVDIKISYFDAIIPFIDGSYTSATEVILPPEYYTAIEYGVMSNIFPKYVPMFENELRRLKEYRSESKDAQLMGDLGGISG